MDTKQLRELIPEVVRITRLAGDKILEVKKRALEQVELKGDGSPVTLADRLAHSLIRKELQMISDLPVLSEEGDLQEVVRQISESPDELFWLVDPLDGTKEFLKDLGEYTVNIALVESKRPILGVVQAPELHTVWSSALGDGAFVHRPGKEAEKIEASSDDEEHRVVASRSHFSLETREFIDGLSESLGKVRLVQKGSSLKLCILAEGKAEVYPRIGPTMIWDTAAGYAVASEAGCDIISMEGKPLSYGPEGDLRQKNFVAFTGRVPGVVRAVKKILRSRQKLHSMN